MYKEKQNSLKDFCFTIPLIDLHHIKETKMIFIYLTRFV